jgi:hypothetical protein
MTRTLLLLLAAGAVAATPARATAQLSTGFSLAGGIAIPRGTGSNQVDNGYNVAAGLNIGAPLIPVGLRLEGAYNAFNAKGSTSGNSASQNVISATANGTFGLGLPYLIGGIGYYSTKETGTSGGVTYNSDRANALGLNGGVGLRFPLGVISTFAEIRYHKMMGSSNSNNLNLPSADVSYIPITFGINF